MKSKNLLLLKTLLLSTSLNNRAKYTKDNKKKAKISGAYVGRIVLFTVIVVYSYLMCMGYGQYGIIDSVPVINAIAISALSFVFTFLKTNGYLFNFKEYDMLMSLPFEGSSVAGCKFLYMYIKSLPWYLVLSLSVMAGYGVYGHPSVMVYPIWVILTFMLPIIPMLAASFAGFLIAKVSAGRKKTNLVQTILTFAFVLFCFSLQYIIQAVFEKDAVEQTLESISETIDNAAKIYLPAAWFAGAVKDLRISDMLLLIGISIVLFAVVFHIVGKNYRNINSALKSHASSRNYKMTEQKKRSVYNAIAFKEFKRLTATTTYMVNGAMGEILTVIVGVLALIIGFDKIVYIVTKGAPFDHSVVTPAIPFIVYFMVGMVATTVCSPSLEGKNYWIVQSLPISKKTLYQGKMLFNMYLTVPFMVFGVICLSISAKVSLIETIMYLILGISLCAFSTAWGCVCGVKHIKLEWENEVEVIKQGTAVLVYLFPNMFVVMALIVGVVFLGMKIDHILIALIMTAIALILAALSYLRVMSLAKRA